MREKRESIFTWMMAMNEETWERHANPWSVYTRIPVLLMLTAALWSRLWLDKWCLVPIVAVLLWIWINPRAFPPPRSTNNWASQATFGERVWLRRKQHPIPREHDRAAALLTAMAAAGLPFLVWGIWELSLWPTAFGLFVTYAGKLWYLDRMVWLHRDLAKGSLPGHGYNLQ